MLTRENINRERVDLLISEARKVGKFDALNHEEREKNRRDFLSKHKTGKDLWVFGYGSLIWNPAFHFEQSQPAKVNGYHRRFCLHLTIGRGSPEKPGIMLALDRGGSCIGVAFKIAADKVESETEILWMREMISGAYQPRWLKISIGDKQVEGFTFVVNRNHERYLGKLPISDTIKRLTAGEGMLGNCKDYLLNTVNCLNELEIKDRYWLRLLNAILET